MNLYFSEYFEVGTDALKEYGAFDISVVSDLPLFVDPFLLFNSENDEYQALHGQIIDYLTFLRSKTEENPNHDLLRNLYCFQEVKQNWLGFTLFGNGGSGLGMDFARSLNESLGSILNNFGQEQVTAGTHLEKLALIKSGVGRDNISDFTTNLIKDYLLEYTQEFTIRHVPAAKQDQFWVRRARFNFETESWETRRYILPKLGSDFVLLTPQDILTRDESWINKGDMFRNFERIPAAIEDESLRAQVNNYLWKRLSRKSTKEEKKTVAQAVFRQFPELIDYYIRSREINGREASHSSSMRVDDVHQVLVAQLKQAIADLSARTDFYQKPWTSLEESLERVKVFKDYVENKDGYKLINRKGKPFSREEEVQLFFGLLWCMTEFDVNREPNNGRGPVDFKISYGSGDKSLIEFKLASNSHLKRNLEKQVEIYKKANNTNKAVKVIICYSRADEIKVANILRVLNLTGDPYVIVVDARNDNKPSASKA
ncbi:hypothetical protein [Glycomyces buryatensis]|uniref:Uncharacterized protein n=1 Tax=Glycomyces buryatensis TaxID=2570927 RepID=A0A4S8QB75_9ACTN|nr:hypothetical protein [Glycomyces buryatensis]THV41773.1 hypothetical protein FAB82_10340 [Glycomyces buryatensis]